jgi:hypothetical protein
MMKHVLMLPVLAFAILACQQTPNLPQARALGILEVELSSGGVSSARLQRNLGTQAVTLREADVVFGTGITQVVSTTSVAHEYLVATFPVSHAPSSSTAFENLTLYALAKNGNIGSTAIKSITNFGGVTDTAEQTRIAKHLVPVHPVTTDNGFLEIAYDADFQAFTTAEVASATSAAASLLGVGDTVLNYGFSARCETDCTEFSRNIPTTGTGYIRIAIRVPKAAASTTYKFTMNFVVLDESVKRVTRGKLQNESLITAEFRGDVVGASRLMQHGLAREQPSGFLENDFVNDVQTSSLGASIEALGLGRLDLGRDHSCGLTSTGTAYCWGESDFGRLGNAASSPDQSSPVAVAAPTGGSVLTFSSIAAGDSHTCGLTITGAAYCWGSNNAGKLGKGSSGSSNVPVAVAAPTGGTVLVFSNLGAGNNHTCGLTTTGAAYCWGQGTSGELGNGASVASDVPVPVSGGHIFSSLMVGGIHTCGITSEGLAYCWGNNTSGQLGIGTSGNGVNSNLPVAVLAPTGGTTLYFSSLSGGFLHTCGVTTSGAGYCWGDGSQRQLGTGNTNSASLPALVSGNLSFESIQAGREYTCGVTTSGQGYCWGLGTAGALGTGNTNPSSVPAAVSGGLTFANIQGGGLHTCGLTTNAKTFCWGQGSSGKLGTGSVSNSPVPASVVDTNYNL